MSTATLTREERSALKQMIDHRRRELITDENSWATCSSCGCHVDEKTTGCTRCSERHRARQRRNTLPASVREERRQSHRIAVSAEGVVRKRKERNPSQPYILQRLKNDHYAITVPLAVLDHFPYYVDAFTCELVPEGILYKPFVRKVAV